MFLTAKRVNVGDELCICYTADESKLWFIPSAVDGASSTSAGQIPSPPLSPQALVSSFDALFDESEDDMPQAESSAMAQHARNGGKTEDPAELRRPKKESLKDKRRQRYLERAGKAEDGGPPETSANTAQTSAFMRPPESSNLLDPSHELTSPTLEATPSSRTAADRRARLQQRELDPELDWEAEGDGEKGHLAWGAMERVKGPTELEEDAEREDESLSMSLKRIRTISDSQWKYGL